MCSFSIYINEGNVYQNKAEAKLECIKMLQDYNAKQTM